MLANLINSLASHTEQTKKMLDEIAEMRAIKAEINKARCVIEFNAEGLITSINELALKALSYSENELISQHHRTLVGRFESQKSEYQDFWAELAAGRSQSGMFELINKEGKTVFFQGYYAPVKNGTGSLRKVVCYLTDVTEAKSKAISLESSDGALNEIFGVVECSTDGKIIDCNELFLDSLGYRKEELVGKDATQIMDRQINQDTEYKSLWGKLLKGEPQTSQVKRLSKDGRELWFNAKYAPVKDHQDNVCKIVIYSECIIADKDKSADFEGQIKAINEIQSVIEFSLDGNVLRANDNYLNVMGYSKDEIVGKHYTKLVNSKETEKESYRNNWKDILSGKSKEGIFKAETKQGKTVYFQAHYCPILDLNGSLFKVVCYSDDVTVYVEAENQVKEKSKEAMMIKSALDSSSTNMMMADPDGLIKYMNPASRKLMVSAAENMRKVLPNFDPERILGQSFDIFHHNPAHQKNLLANLKEAYETNIEVGEMFFKLKASPIFLDDGTRMGTALEWVDTTQERKIENEISDLVQKASDGDLSNRLSLEDKTGAAVKICSGINTLIEKMTDLILQVREAGETINTAAGEISTGNNDLSSRTEQQASSLEETASSMEQLASTVKQNAENAKQANQLAAAASGVAIKGGSVVNEVVTTMADINNSSRKIEDIISVIDGIAFQTNILALNAAVEAARAGEQGRGFAVVAGEVRNLAQRSAGAAKEIKQLISASVAKVQDGTKLVENAGQTMNEIVSSVQRVTDIMGEISAASTEQSSGIDQVNNAITDMDEVTQQNAALVEQAAAAAESLVDQAVSLMDTVSRYKVKGGHASASNVQSTTNELRRPVPRPSPPKPAFKAAPSKLLAKTGTDDGDWEEF